MNLSQAIVAYEVRTTAVVESILSQVVSSGTQCNYAYHNVDLVLWIYQRQEWGEELMRDWMVDSLIYAKQKGNKETRDTCKSYMKEVNRSNNNCPVVLEKLILNIFSHYMSTKNSKNSWGYLSSASCGGVRSSLTHMYRMSGKTMDGGFKK